MFKELKGKQCHLKEVSRDEAGEAGKARAGEPIINILDLLLPTLLKGPLATVQRKGWK